MTAVNIQHIETLNDTIARLTGIRVREPALLPERVMVCMSSNTEAARIIRTGVRIAGRPGSRWYAVYVETPRERADRINPKDREALARNVALADSPPRIGDRPVSDGGP